MRLSNRALIWSVFHTNSRWIAGRTYSLLWTPSRNFGDGNGGLEHSVDLDWWGGCGSGDALPRSGASALLQQR
jgi:hypothetical protein